MGKVGENGNGKVDGTRCKEEHELEKTRQEISWRVQEEKRRSVTDWTRQRYLHPATLLSRPLHPFSGTEWATPSTILILYSSRTLSALDVLAAPTVLLPNLDATASRL